MKKLKKWTVMLTAVFVMLMVSQRAMDVLAANGDIASGKDKNITWVIDGSGKLTVHGPGILRTGFRGMLTDFALLRRWFR